MIELNKKLILEILSSVLQFDILFGTMTIQFSSFITALLLPISLKTNEAEILRCYLYLTGD